MRALVPQQLVSCGPNLWVIDKGLPVAAVLGQGEPALVSWSRLPPAAGPWRWPPPRYLAGGDGLWVQTVAGGPLVYLGPEGTRSTTWTDDLWLAAAGPGAAWCTPVPPQQEVIEGRQSRPSPGGLPGLLLRVTDTGRRERCDVEGRVHEAQVVDGTLFVLAERDGYTLVSLGGDTYEVHRETGWLGLPIDAPLPELLTFADHGLPDHHPGQQGDGGQLATPWLEEQTPVVAHRLGWRAGWSLKETSRDARRVIVTVTDPDDNETARWNLGPGSIHALVAHGDGVALVMERGWWASPIAKPTHVLALSPLDAAPRALLEAELDIATVVPLPNRPVDADSYEAAVLAQHQVPALTGVGDARTRLIGQWPDRQLEWRFTHPSRPGLRLRRQLDLYDRLGRPTPPEYSDIHLMEDLGTDALPPADLAVEGTLDV